MRTAPQRSRVDPPRDRADLLGQSGVSIQAIAWVLEHSEAQLIDRLVLLALANHADASWCCFPSVAQISVEARCSERQVFRSLNELERIGEIERSTGRGRGRRNTYRVAASKGCQDVTLNPNFTLTSCPETLTDRQLKPDTAVIQTVINRHEPSRARTRGTAGALNDWEPTGEGQPLSLNEKRNGKEQIQALKEGAGR